MEASKEKDKKSTAQKILSTIGTLALAIAVIFVMDTFGNGLRLSGVPNVSDVAKVTVNYAGEEKEYTDQENIELAIGLTSWLRHSVMQASGEDQPLLTMTYTLQSGTELTVSANETTVWWQGKAYDLKQEGAFMKLAKVGFELGE